MADDSLLSGCSESSVVTAENSSQFEYFKELYLRKDAPIEDYLVLWYPESEHEYDGAYFFGCEEKQITGNYLTPECKHEVFYSWGPIEKLDTMKTAMPDAETWFGSPNPQARVREGYLFMALTPASTITYGEVGVRVRMKPEVRIRVDKWRPSEGLLTMRPKSHTYEDVVLNDASSIESWSYGTPEQYDELVLDIKRMASGKRAHYYAERKHRLNMRTGMKRVYVTIDGYKLNEKKLKDRLHQHIGMIINGEGRIHYQNGTCRNRVLFFATDKPSYFNPE